MTAEHDGPGVRVGFVGAGRLAWSLAPAIARAGYHVTAIAAREGEAAERLARAVGADARGTTHAAEVLDAATLVFLTVEDAGIGALAAALPWGPHHLVVHCGGALGLEVLAPAVDAGARAGCLHPLQSFPAERAEPERLRGAACGVEGAEPLGGLLEQIAVETGMRPFRLEGVDRALYHAAAVFAGNNAVALMSAAQRAWEMAGLPADNAREALAPLLLAVAENLRTRDLVDALSGPVARGDARTVGAHLAALAAAPDLAALYRALSLELLRIATRLDGDARAALEQQLEGTAGA